jgi:ribonuclease-3
VIADALFIVFPDLPEGDLSRLRANLVRQETLASAGA